MCLCFLSWLGIESNTQIALLGKAQVLLKNCEPADGLSLTGVPHASAMLFDELRKCWKVLVVCNILGLEQALHQRQLQQGNRNYTLHSEHFLGDWGCCMDG